MGAIIATLFCIGVVGLVGILFHALLELGVMPFSRLWWACLRQHRRVSRRASQLVDQGFSLRDATKQAKSELQKSSSSYSHTTF